MYHELTHKIGSTTDIVYNRAQCQQLAAQRPPTAPATQRITTCF
jgi:hypothetical protein